jgi:hypothetical protein
VPERSQRILSDLFEAYAAALSCDLGPHRFNELFAWYYAMVSPYAVAYHALYTASAASSASAVSQLMEYATQWKLGPPHFNFSILGEGSSTVWQCSVVVAGTGANGEGKSKSEAKSMACAEVLRILPHVNATLNSKPKKEERRKKKEDRRKAMAAAASSAATAANAAARNINQKDQFGGEAMKGVVRNNNVAGSFMKGFLPWDIGS